MNLTRPKLGQNFLVDKDWQQRIIDAFQPKGGFGEIGPGHGELTQHLSKKFSNFTVFEKDREFAKTHRLQTHYKTVEGDFLGWDFCLEEKKVSEFSFIGNLPYEAGTAIVKRIIERADQVDHFVFMLQKEVVDRMMAKPRTREFGSLSILVQGQYDLESIGTVPAKAFDPAPKVLSAVFRGNRRKNGAHPNDPKYHRFLMTAFSMKRKVLKNILKSQISLDQLKDLYKNFQWVDTIRAEEINVDLWPEIYAWIKAKRDE
jgi:16S rRNA (adenine1518-N6/adenine1519-N6)-dimethyltransferase